MSQQWPVEGKNFLITGGASGLGALYAEAFLKEGAKNVAILDVAEEIGKATTDRLNEAYTGKAIFIKCDVGDENAVTIAFDEVVDKFKQLDVIINNAGIMVDSPAVYSKACDVNWRGLVSFTMKGVKHMRKDEGGAGGTIINISSTAALTRLRQLPIYCGSKMAVLHFSQCLAIEPFYEQTGVRILTTCLGPTATNLMQNLSTRGYDEIICRELHEMGETTRHLHQKPESAVAACMKIYKEGTNGSIWLTKADKPAVDISSTIDSVFSTLEKLVYSP